MSSTMLISDDIRPPLRSGFRPGRLDCDDFDVGVDLLADESLDTHERA
jgi:hypothetical protein